MHNNNNKIEACKFGDEEENELNEESPREERE